MTWFGRFFDARDALVRMILLDLSGVGYLIFYPHGTAPRAPQWALAVVAFTAALLLRRRQGGNLLVQSALLVTAFLVLDDPTINEVGAGWALLELTIVAAPARRWWSVGLLCAIYLAGGIGEPLGQLPQRLYGLNLVVGVPLLLGMVIRTTAELGRQAAERAAEQSRRRESEARAARADERGAIARELHDVVAHHVASMVLRVGVARHVLPDLGPEVREILDDVHGTGSAALADLRRLVSVLRDPDGVRGGAALTAIEPGSLPTALDGAVEAARRAGLVVDAEISPTVGELDAVRALAVLRLTQEALTNVARHAGAGTHVRLAVAVGADTVHWSVTDDGDGEGETGTVPPGGGHGLTGMRERVSLLGGELRAGPEGTGWTVRTALPALVAS
ncbi:sensor histidine kinase [Actinoplanes sp. NPDC051494]|uniref:sensor histidine kinase n=1 Tax=Actinoplanes sp. NPDC051494 TaxID=3363907 RepID=UPI00378F963D